MFTGLNDYRVTMADEDYAEAIECLETFYQMFWKQWENENKPFGFDIQDFSLGGLLRRLETCRERLLAYVDGRTEAILELETELLKGTGKFQWTNIATPNVVSHHVFV